MVMYNPQRVVIIIVVVADTVAFVRHAAEKVPMSEKRLI